MIFSGLSHALRGASGEFEITRLIGGVGALAYIIGAHTFLAWNQAEGVHFDLATYCLAFPTGLAAAVGATAGAAAYKDKAVASAKVTEQTGTIPAPPPAGPPTPVGDPPPVEAEP